MEVTYEDPQDLRKETEEPRNHEAGSSRIKTGVKKWKRMARQGDGIGGTDQMAHTVKKRKKPVSGGVSSNGGKQARKLKGQ